MQKLKIAFFGTPSYSAYLLEKIINDKELPVEVKLVITQPDRPVGKKQVVTPSPVKLVAEKYGINVGVGLSDPKKGAKTAPLQNIHLAIVCAFGQILPGELLTIPKYGFWNIHYSLLPKYRGGAPSAYALMNGDHETGVTILQMDEKLDHGPIIAQEKTAILPDERRPDLEMRLTQMTFSMLKKLINVIARTASDAGTKQSNSIKSGERSPRSLSLPRDDMLNGIERKNQKHSDATYAPLLKKQDGFISIESLKTALKNKQLITVYNRFRGLSPWPGLWTFVTVNGQQKRLRIIDMDNHSIKKVQLEGKKEVDFATFNRAYNVFT